ncbi:DNA-J related domain-containing protein [Hydrogenovibrio sp. 3SP14C1]|uniref:DNA-J related domain-containing protein n=1 Tax=Hydrogenovibrio sp. 3SP14C1 TaxID=3038774 RepID=UPI002415E667|nr:DNA-J related domain-containing protein [Hydrogenovibrio sp. 3SP14C1]
MTIPQIPPLFEEAVYQLLSNGEPIKEYDLMKRLVSLGFDQFTPSLEPLELFRAHFLLFHLLYRLQDKWHTEKKGALNIHTLDIYLDSTLKEDTAQKISEIDGVKTYYLDYETFIHTQEQDVIDLIDGFWESLGHKDTLFYSEQEVEKAKQTLEIEADITPKKVQTQYRKLSQIHHPDKGGKAEIFHAICQAKEVLLTAVKA